jgi:sugar phosphate isomerase/epimerase
MDVGTADPAGADLDQDVVRTADRIGHVHVGHLFIFGEEQGFHRKGGRRVLGRGARLG